MRVICTYGSVRGATGNRRPFRDAFAHLQRVHTIGGLSPNALMRRSRHLTPRATY